MFRGIDHVAVVVRDLEVAIDTYSRLGFAVVRGGRHPNGSHNAFMSFANGSVLELFGFLDPAHPNEHRYWKDLQRGEGLVDWCMESDDLQTDVARLRDAGVEIDDPIARSRTRPDGVELQWKVAITRPRHRGIVPFLIQDITPRSQRIPAVAPHPNECSGITEIVIAVQSFDLVRAWGLAALGHRRARTETAELVFTVGQQRLRWVHAATDGPLALHLDPGNLGPRDIDPEHAHGVRLQFRPFAP